MCHLTKQLSFQSSGLVFWSWWHFNRLRLSEAVDSERAGHHRSETEREREGGRVCQIRVSLLCCGWPHRTVAAGSSKQFSTKLFQTGENMSFPKFLSSIVESSLRERVEVFTASSRGVWTCAGGDRRRRHPQTEDELLSWIFLKSVGPGFSGNETSSGAEGFIKMCTLYNDIHISQLSRTCLMSFIFPFWTFWSKLKVLNHLPFV